MNAHSASSNQRNLADSFEIELNFLKEIILEIFWPELLEAS